MPAHDYDVVVIGSGAGGLGAAITAARLGARVAIVEGKQRTGGDCTWYGCVPSKALIRCARAVSEARSSARFGVTGYDPSSVKVDWAAVKSHLRSCQERIYQQDDSPESLAKKGVETILNRTASFVSPHELLLTATDPSKPGDAPGSVTTDFVVVATGAGPALPPIDGLSEVPYYTYETVFTMETFPSSLLVVGGGPIGAELAQAFAKLGSKVTIVAKLLPREDDDVRELMSKVFTADGIEVVEGRATKVQQRGGKIVLEAGGRALEADALLVSAGRRPKGLKAMNLDRAGVVWSDKDGIKVDAKLRTSVSNIYAVGDCTGGLQFTHLAAVHGGKAAGNALLPGTMFKAPKDDEVPRCTFTHPEVATVGLTTAQAKEQHGEAAIITKLSLDHVDRAICEGETDGFIKIVHTKKGKILGATVVSNVAGETAGELGLAIKTGTTIKAIQHTIHSYPSWSFGLWTLASEFLFSANERSPVVKVVRACCVRRMKGNSLRPAK